MRRETKHSQRALLTSPIGYSSISSTKEHRTVTVDRLYRYWKANAASRDRCEVSLLQNQKLCNLRKIRYHFTRNALSLLHADQLTGFQTSQDIPRILWNQKVHYRIRKSQPPGLILSQVTLVHPHHIPLLEDPL